MLFFPKSFSVLFANHHYYVWSTAFFFSFFSSDIVTNMYLYIYWFSLINGLCIKHILTRFYLHFDFSIEVTHLFLQIFNVFVQLKGSMKERPPFNVFLMDMNKSFFHRAFQLYLVSSRCHNLLNSMRNIRNLFCRRENSFSIFEGSHFCYSILIARKRKYANYIKIIMSFLSQNIHLFSILKVFYFVVSF